jgi:hypothetical protein
MREPAVHWPPLTETRSLSAIGTPSSVERETVAVGDRDPSVRHEDAGVRGHGDDADGLVGLEVA